MKTPHLWIQGPLPCSRLPLVGGRPLLGGGHPPRGSPRPRQHRLRLLGTQFAAQRSRPGQPACNPVHPVPSGRAGSPPSQPVRNPVHPDWHVGTLTWPYLDALLGTDTSHNRGTRSGGRCRRRGIQCPCPAADRASRPSLGGRAHPPTESSSSTPRRASSTRTSGGG